MNWIFANHKPGNDSIHSSSYPAKLDDDQSAIFHLSTYRRQEFVFHPAVWRGTMRARPFLRLLASLCETSRARSRRTRFVLAPRARSFRGVEIYRAAAGGMSIVWYWSTNEKSFRENPRLEKLTFISRNAVDGAAWANLSGASRLVAPRFAPFIDGCEKGSWNFDENFRESLLDRSGKINSIILFEGMRWGWWERGGR